MGLLIEIATADAGLVRDDHDRPMQLIRPEPRQWENSRDELELLRAMDVAAIHIDHAVTVEKESATGHIFVTSRRVKNWTIFSRKCWETCPPAIWWYSRPTNK